MPRPPTHLLESVAHSSLSSSPGIVVAEHVAAQQASQLLIQRQHLPCKESQASGVGEGVCDVQWVAASTRRWASFAHWEARSLQLQPTRQCVKMGKG